jgi:maleamate amidohydrolase
MSSFGGRAGLGRRPALLVVDMSRGFTDAASPLACEVAGALDAIATLLDRARRVGVSVTFTTVAYDKPDLATAAAFLDKVPALRMLEAGSPWVEIDPRIAPTASEPVLTKLFASAFFGTELAAILKADAIDSLLVTGASTSGCVRATVIDALQHGFRPVVAREAVADRDRAAHDQSLADIDGRYGDVVTLVQALAWLDGDIDHDTQLEGARS